MIRSIVGDKFIDQSSEDCPFGEIEVVGSYTPSKKKWEAFKKNLKDPKVKSFSEKYDLDTGKRKETLKESKAKMRNII